MREKTNTNFKPLKVAVMLFEQVNTIDIAGPIEAFTCVRNPDGKSAYELNYWSLDNLTVTTESGLRIMANENPGEHPAADILIIPGGNGIRQPDVLQKLAKWLHEHHQNFKRIASVCTGTYALAESGLLNGRKATTHWEFTRDLQARYPDILVEPDVLFVGDDKFYSSGGVTAGIDLALDLIENDFGVSAAMKVARELVVFLRRTGTQNQYSVPLQLQATASNKLIEVCKWAAANLDEDLSVSALSERSGLSVRQFTRKFSTEFGMPPALYIKRLRLDTARTLLEQGITLSRTTFVVGFKSEEGFRKAFEAQFGVTPSKYQKRHTIGDKNA